MCVLLLGAWAGVMKKKVDSRIRTLIENGVAQRHRTFIVLVGDKGKDQVRGLIRPVIFSSLWCVTL